MTDIVWITNEGGGTGSGVFRYSASGTPDAVPFFANGALDNPTAAALVTNGATQEVWISNDQTTILRFGLDDTLLGTITDAGFDFPYALLYIPSIDKVWVAGGDNTIFVYHPDGTPTGVSYTPDPTLNPEGLAIGPDGAIWVANGASAATFPIWRLTTSGTPYGGGNLSVTGYPRAFDLATVGSTVWMVGGSDIAVIDSSGTILHTITDPTGGHIFELGLVGTEVWGPDTFGSAHVYRFDTATSTLVGTIIDSGFGQPYAVLSVPASAPVAPRAWFFTPMPALAPAAPVLISPQLTDRGGGLPHGIGPSLLTTQTVTYSWASTLFGAAYQLQVSTDPTFATTLHDVTGLTGLTYLETTTLLDATEYYWRVRATGGGVTGPWSYTAWFVVLDSYDTISPAEGTTVVGTYNPLSSQYEFPLSWTMQGGEVETHTQYFVFTGGPAPGSQNSTFFTPPRTWGEDETSATSIANGTGPYVFTFYRGLSGTRPVGGDPALLSDILAVAPGLVSHFTLT